MVQNDRAILGRLSQAQVEFVVIGGVCAVLHGVSVVTFDLDICGPFSEANLRRLETALKDLHPYHRLTPQHLPLQLTNEVIPQLKNLYLQTDWGKLDCLTEVAGLGSYDTVKERSIEQNTSYGRIRLLSLDALISAKQAMGRDRDVAAVKQLTAIRERLSQNPPKPGN